MTSALQSIISGLSADHSYSEFNFVSIIVGQKTTPTLPKPLVILPHRWLLQLLRFDHDPLASEAHKESLFKRLICKFAGDDAPHQRLEDQTLKSTSHLKGCLVLNHNFVKQLNVLDEKTWAFTLNNFIHVSDFKALFDGKLEVVELIGLQHDSVFGLD